MADDIGHEIGSHLSMHALNKKMGPLPVWGWGVLLGGGIVAYMYFHNSSSAAATVPPADPGTIVPLSPDGLPEAPSTLPDLSGVPISGGGSDPYDPMIPPTEPAGDTTGGTASPILVTVEMPQAHRDAHPHIMAARHAKTNKGWAQGIRKALLAHGWRPHIVNHALHNYLTGKHLTGVQHHAINQAHVWAAPPHPHAIPAMHHNMHTEPHGGAHRAPAQHHQTPELSSAEHRRHVYYARHH